MTNIIDYKNKKKVKVLETELIDAVQKLSASIELLKNHSKYIPIMESLSILHNSRTLLEIHLNKCKRILESGEDKLASEGKTNSVRSPNRT